jgi:nicotinate-nucleotide pyrophosphorylase (carboxylating)
MLQLPSDLAQQVTTALAEDIGSGDITAQLVPAAQRVTGKVITSRGGDLMRPPSLVRPPLKGSIVRRTKRHGE